MLRVVFFGSAGEYSGAHLDALAHAHRVVGLFCAMQSRGLRGAAGRLLRRIGLRSDPCGAVARRHRIPRWFCNRDGSGLAAAVASLRPDVICVASYPWLLPAAVWGQARLGAVNSHGSLLPRHRGVLPLFWIYYHDDAETGVTVHRLTDRPDAGDILAQERFPLPRGFPVERLNALNAERGSRLMIEALDALTAGPGGTPQDDARATFAPRVPPGRAMIDFAWDVERVWHFLAGLFPWFLEPLHDGDGAEVRYRSVLGYQRARHAQTPGTVRRDDTGWLLFCSGGFVSLGSGAGAGGPNRA